MVFCYIWGYMRDGPLDMKMGRTNNKNSYNNYDKVNTGDSCVRKFKTADVCNEFDVVELHRIFSFYGYKSKVKTVAQKFV